MLQAWLRDGLEAAGGVDVRGTSGSCGPHACAHRPGNDNVHPILISSSALVCSLFPPDKFCADTTSQVLKSTARHLYEVCCDASAHSIWHAFTISYKFVRLLLKCQFIRYLFNNNTMLIPGK